jgi:hypothetical protein
MPWDGNASQHTRDLLDTFEANASPDFRMRVLKQAQQRPQPSWSTSLSCVFALSALSRLAAVAAVLVLICILPTDWPLVYDPARHPQRIAQVPATNGLTEAPLPAPAIAFATGAPLTRLMQVGVDALFDTWFSEKEQRKDTPWKQGSDGPRGKQVL